MLIPQSTGLVYPRGGGGWDITTATFVQNFSVSSETGSPLGVTFKPDGTKMYVNSFDIYEYDLSTAWDISTASYNQNDGSVITRADGLYMKPDGQKAFTINSDSDDVREYALSTAWDISTISFTQSFSISSQNTSPGDVTFKPDGTKMYVTGDGVGGGADSVYEYDLSTAWDISTASYLQRFYYGGTTFSPGATFFKPDGSKMYLQDRGSNRKIWEYDLSTAWDVTTASYLQLFDFSSQESAATGLFIRDDGLKLYITGSSGDDVNEYDLDP